MLIRNTPSWQLTDKDVTPEHLYLNRRSIMAAGGALAATAFAGACSAQDSGEAAPHTANADGSLNYATTDYRITDGDLTPVEAVTGYNNFYEFGTGKDDPARYADAMTTDPWSVEVTGHAARTGTFAVEDLVDFSALEERIYRLRCVEAWSMVIPWIGVPLSSILNRFEPTSDARYVAFETYLNREEMRGVRFPVLDWPYREGLRLDEAMNPLAFMAVGLYGNVLPNQNGAPMRLVVPWKYGFKSIKSIVRISFVSEEPVTTWKQSAPREYGFYSNVNPERSHPRWSQASERIIGAGPFARRDTEMFNGYGEAVADLYAGMDLNENY
ncbi:protein-methionine-sulfoxide reductase catalytic subunit MsrP [Hyphobacterium marinum]|uniref:Protein-methionine-sulfoxide reductase catalytic subunit MsrP n=1 Tax=Hyphobacterium marinum TaxID=3116574 RepID=A0ABU7LUF4_9PROT|nr:protein-methionine-sulfoxide reductase catalytic subunit MsrP [Hyphobacterium sp. Y6023]MEE2565169.1 protein-methionine-sulfoxide reductase catalytic subunit MsrP [Hyphobacterium sp. Y6023]